MDLTQKIIMALRKAGKIKDKIEPICNKNILRKVRGKNICLPCKKCYPIQPERSKREDLDCCKEVTNLEYLYDRYETYVMEHDQKSSDIIKDLLNKSKMRCSEHCGNTVRDK